MKKNAYLEKQVITIPEFVVHGEYKDEAGNDYKVLSIEGEMMTAKFNYVTRKFRIVKFGSRYAAVNQGRPWFFSAPSNPDLLAQDYTCDIVPRGKYQKLGDLTPEQKRERRRERARKRRKARREKLAINNS